LVFTRKYHWWRAVKTCPWLLSVICMYTTRSWSCILKQWFLILTLKLQLCNLEVFLLHCSLIEPSFLPPLQFNFCFALQPAVETCQSYNNLRCVNSRCRKRHDGCFSSDTLPFNSRFCRILWLTSAPKFNLWTLLIFDQEFSHYCWVFAYYGYDFRVFLVKKKNSLLNIRGLCIIIFWLQRVMNNYPYVVFEK